MSTNHLGRLVTPFALVSWSQAYRLSHAVRESAARAAGTLLRCWQVNFGWLPECPVTTAWTADRFPGDVPHQTHVQSETAALYMVTTVPHVSQVGPR